MPGDYRSMEDDLIVANRKFTNAIKLLNSFRRQPDMFNSAVFHDLILAVDWYSSRIKVGPCLGLRILPWTILCTLFRHNSADRYNYQFA